MSFFLRNRQIVLGVTGGVAAYKSADLARRLREAGAIVQVVMTKSAQAFITPLTMQAVSGLPVRSSLFDTTAEAAMGHIELARWADMIVVAPASADFLARLAAGRADDLLTTLCLATKAPIVVAPAMNQVMWKNELTQKNVQVLREQKMHFIGPVSGSQACGEIGPGRLSEPVDIVAELNTLFNTKPLAGLHFLITAGTTREAIDPVRFISNASSGKMGYALAQAAIEAGASVTLVSGPVTLSDKPTCAEIINVVTAQEMHEAVQQHIASCDIFVAVAAVADYRCKNPTTQKIHKTEETLWLELERTPDIVGEVAKRANKPFIVGFAAETENVVENAKNKRLRKGMDVIIANQVGFGLGFDSDENAVTLISKEGTEEFMLAAKTKLARQLLERIGALYKTLQSNVIKIA